MPKRWLPPRGRPVPPPSTPPTPVVSFEIPTLPISAWAAAHLGFTPDPAQAEFLDLTHPRIALCASRQSGKTQVAAAKALHSALTIPNSDYLVFSPVTRQGNNLLHRLRTFCKSINIPTKSDPHHDHSLLLPNGSRFLVLPGIPENVRGFASVQAVIIDEAAFIDDAIYPAVSPMLAISQGHLWALSTPYGQTNRFYEICNTPDLGWTVLRASAEDCPRISKAFLASERALHGEAIYAQEYACVFVASSEQFLDRELIVNAQLPYQHRNRPCYGFNELFFGIDVGKRKDHTAIVAVELDLTQSPEIHPVSGENTLTAHLLVRHIEILPLGTDHLELPGRIVGILNQISGTFKQRHVAIDATGENTLIEVFRREKSLSKVNFSPSVITAGHAPSQLPNGYKGIPRADLLGRLKSALTSRKLTIPEYVKNHEDLVKELITFQYDGKQSGHDDIVFALAFAVWYAYERHKNHFLPQPRR